MGGGLSERYLQRSEFVLDVVEQILGVADELAVGVEVEAATEGVGGAFVERPNIEFGVRRAALDLVRGELVAPAERVPDAGIIGADGGGAIDGGETLDVLAAAGDQQRRELLQRFDVVGITLQRALRQLQARGDVVRGLAPLCFGEQGAGIVARLAQCNPSTSLSASGSVNTRNEFVRTLPWLPTARDTRVIVSSSGASAMMT